MIIQEKENVYSFNRDHDSEEFEEFKVKLEAEPNGKVNFAHFFYSDQSSGSYENSDDSDDSERPHRERPEGRDWHRKLILGVEE